MSASSDSRKEAMDATTRGGGTRKNCGDGPVTTEVALHEIAQDERKPDHEHAARREQSEPNRDKARAVGEARGPDIADQPVRQWDAGEIGAHREACHSAAPFAEVPGDQRHTSADQPHARPPHHARQHILHNRYIDNWAAADADSNEDCGPKISALVLQPGWHLMFPCCLVVAFEGRTSLPHCTATGVAYYWGG